MDLVVSLVDAPPDLVSVTVEVRIVDQSEADAPARELATRTIGPIAVDDGSGQVRVILPAVPMEPGIEPSVNLRVRGRTAAGQTPVFMNTSEITIPHGKQDVMAAEVVRI